MILVVHFDNGCGYYKKVRGVELDVVGILHETLMLELCREITWV